MARRAGLLTWRSYTRWAMSHTIRDKQDLILRAKRIQGQVQALVRGLVPSAQVLRTVAANPLHHRPLHDPGKKLIQLDRRVHGPRHHHFLAAFDVTIENSPRYTLAANPALQAGPQVLHFPSLHRIRGKICGYVPRTDRHQMNAAAREFHAGSLANRI